MSLRDAVTEIITQMEEDLKEGDYPDEDNKPLFKSYLRQLKSAVKASEGEQPAAPTETQRLQELAEKNPKAYHMLMTDKARQEFRGKVTPIPGTDAPAALLAQEMFEPGMAEMVDGPGNGTFAPIAPEMPIGAKVRVGGATYELEADRKLHYRPPTIRGAGPTP